MSRPSIASLESCAVVAHQAVVSASIFGAGRAGGQCRGRGKGENTQASLQSNRDLREVKARSGKVIALATEGDEEIQEAADHVIFIPPAPEELAPILEIVPLQLLAYHIAVRRGCDVDQPRNLAKSVTVE